MQMDKGCYVMDAYSFRCCKEWYDKPTDIHYEICFGDKLGILVVCVNCPSGCCLTHYHEYIFMSSRFDPMLDQMQMLQMIRYRPQTIILQMEIELHIQVVAEL